MSVNDPARRPSTLIWGALLERLAEPSTWRGIVRLIQAFGIALDPDQIALILVVGEAVKGAIGVLCKDRVK